MDWTINIKVEQNHFDDHIGHSPGCFSHPAKIEHIQSLSVGEQLIHSTFTTVVVSLRLSQITVHWCNTKMMQVVYICLHLFLPTPSLNCWPQASYLSPRQRISLPGLSAVLTWSIKTKGRRGDQRQQFDLNTNFQSKLQWMTWSLYIYIHCQCINESKTAKVQKNWNRANHLCSIVPYNS